MFSSYYGQIRSFFTLPTSLKLAYRADLNNRGYTPFGDSTLDPDGPSPDACEGFYWGRHVSLDDPEARLPLHGPNQWPSEELLPGFQRAIGDFYTAHATLAHRLLRIMALSLGLRPEHFDSCFARPLAILRALHFPVADSPWNADGWASGAGSLERHQGSTAGSVASEPWATASIAPRFVASEPGATDAPGSLASEPWASASAPAPSAPAATPWSRPLDAPLATPFECPPAAPTAPPWTVPAPPDQRATWVPAATGSPGQAAWIGLPSGGSPGQLPQFCQPIPTGHPEQQPSQSPAWAELPLQPQAPHALQTRYQPPAALAGSPSGPLPPSTLSSAASQGSIGALARLSSGLSNGTAILGSPSGASGSGQPAFPFSAPLAPSPASAACPVSLGAHADYGAFSILSSDGTPGLEARPGGGKWVRLPSSPGLLLVVPGNLLERWSNGLYQALLHRVRVRDERYSTSFYFEPNYRTAVEPLPICCDASNPPKFLPMVTGAYLKGKYKTSHKVFAQHEREGHTEKKGMAGSARGGKGEGGACRAAQKHAHAS